MGGGGGGCGRAYGPASSLQIILWDFFAFKFVDKMNTNHFLATFPAIAFLIVSMKHARTSTQRALTSAGELGTMSKNNLREITFGIRPIWGINSLLHTLLFGIRTQLKSLILLRPRSECFTFSSRADFPDAQQPLHESLSR